MKHVIGQACVICGTTGIDSHFCRHCRSELQWIAVACARCGQPLPRGTAAATLCAECQLRSRPFAKAFAPLRYAFPVDSALKALKFQRQLCYAPAFGGLLLQPFATHFELADALLPVPLHRWRHARRGFNQAQELCRPLRRETGLPLIRNVTRIRHTGPQTGLDVSARKRNMKGAFRVRGRIVYRRPLIVDDVITTGETCGQLATALLNDGAETVFVLAVARASGV